MEHLKGKTVQSIRTGKQDPKDKNSYTALCINFTDGTSLFMFATCSVDLPIKDVYINTLVYIEKDETNN